MRVLKVTQAYYPFQERGGPAIKVRSIARALTEKGHQVTVLTADLGFGPDQVAAVSAVRNSHGWRSDLDQVEAVYFTTRCSYRNLTVSSGVRAFCRARMQGFDIAHIYGLYDLLGPVVARYCRRFGVPYMIEPLGMTRPIDRGFLLKRVWNTLAAGYLKRATKMVATSEQEQGEMVADGFPESQVLVRFNGIDRSEFAKLPEPGRFRAKLGINPEERLIVFLGRLIPRKGADLLIEALARLDGYKLKLVIVGPEAETGYVSFLKTKAQGLGVEGHVLFVGPLYGEEKKAAFADAWLFALPSRYENFGNSAVEAIACGTPALVSDQCGVAPLINHRAGVVTAYDSDAITKTIKDLLSDQGHYQKLKLGCAALADEICWDRLVSQIEDSYQSAITKG